MDWYERRTKGFRHDNNHRAYFQSRAVVDDSSLATSARYMPVATDPDSDNRQTPLPRDGGLVEDMLGRKQDKGRLCLLCAVATLLGLLVLVVLLWARSAHFCSREHESDGWEEGKQRWCCAMFERGCAAGFDTDRGVERTKLAINCSVDSELWETGWSELKKLYCCKEVGKGCEARNGKAKAHAAQSLSSTKSTLYDCSAGWSDWYVRWTAKKQAWCCQSAGRGCLVPNSSAHDMAYCNASRNPVHNWSPVKKEWCCWFRGLGCPGTSTLAQFDCSGDELAAVWSIPKRRWCCENLLVGCDTTTSRPSIGLLPQ